MARYYLIDGKRAEALCFLCGAWVPICESKVGKPYWTCDHCGMQVFVRKLAGIEAVEEGARDPRVDDFRLLEEA